MTNFRTIGHQFLDDRPVFGDGLSVWQGRRIAQTGWGRRCRYSFDDHRLERTFVDQGGIAHQVLDENGKRDQSQRQRHDQSPLAAFEGTFDDQVAPIEREAGSRILGTIKTEHAG